MSEEEIDQYLIHSDVFSLNDDDTNDDKFSRNSVRFLIPSNGKDAKIHLDDDGDADVCRPERIELSLGILFLWATERQADCRFV